MNDNTQQDASFDVNQPEAASTATGTSDPLEKAVNGEYEFGVGAIISEAWSKTKGSKTNILLAVLLYMLISLIAHTLVSVLLSLFGLSTADPGLGSGIAQLVVTVLTLPIGVGIFFIGVKQSMGLEHSVGEVLGYYDKTLPLVIGMVIMYIMVMLGFMLLILPGIYLAVAYYFGSPLIADKGLGPWQALETSRKSITKNWFGFFGLAIVLVIINLIGAIPLGIGLLWTIPMSVVAYGIAYRNMYGYEPPDELF